MELKEATVMVVDDEPMLLDIFGGWLQEENCRVLTAGDGAAALQILRNHNVDVIRFRRAHAGPGWSFTVEESHHI